MLNSFLNSLCLHDHIRKRAVSDDLFIQAYRYLYVFFCGDYETGFMSASFFNDQVGDCLSNSKAANAPATINPLPKRQTLDSSRLKEFADDNFKFYENGKKLSIWVENRVGKGEIACYKQFLLFP